MHLASFLGLNSRNHGEMFRVADIVLKPRCWKSTPWYLR